MQPTPSSPSTSSRSSSTQRFISEYDGWWISSGVPSSRRIRTASRGALARVGGDAGVQRLALAHGGVERAERLLQRRVGVQPVRVEDVDVVEPHAGQALVQRGEQVLARAPLAVRAGPHVVAGLGGDDQLVAPRREVLAHEPAEVGLRGAGRRPVVVGEVEVGDAEVERAAQDRALRLDAACRRRSCSTARARSRAAGGRCARSGGRASARSGRPRARRSWRGMVPAGRAGGRAAAPAAARRR